MVGFVILLIASYCFGGFALSFTDFGISSGDLKISNSSSSVEVTLEKPVVYYGDEFNSVFVSEFAINN